MKGRILVVDDEEAVREVLKRILIKVGYEVLTCESGDDALVWVKGQPSVVVLLDMRMPGKDGLDTLKEIKRLSPKTQVVMVSGSADMARARETLAQGALDYICKPLDWVNFLNKVSFYSLLAANKPGVDEFSDGHSEN